MFRKISASVLLLGIISAVLLTSSLSAQVANRADTFIYENQLPEGEAYDVDGSSAIVSSGGIVKAYVRSGTGWAEQFTFFPSRFYFRYGEAVILEGDLAIVSAFGFCPRYDEDNTPGGIFVYRRTGDVWMEQQVIEIPCTAGHKIDFDGSTLAIVNEGDYDDYDITFRLFSYNGSTFSQVITLNPANCSAYGGSNIAVDGDILAIMDSCIDEIIRPYIYEKIGGVWTWVAELTQSGYDAIDIDNGTVFVNNRVYTKVAGTWTLQTTLVPDEATANFARGVSLEGDTVLLSGSDKSFIFTGSGATWTEQQKLTTTGTTSVGSDDVEVDGEIAHVGKYVFNQNPISYPVVTLTPTIIPDPYTPFVYQNEFPSGTDYALDESTVLVNQGGGIAKVFIRSGSDWVEQAVLEPLSPDTTFGTALALQGDTAAVGTAGNCDTDTDAEVSIFKRSGLNWLFQQELAVPCGVTTQSLDLDGNRIFAGAEPADQLRRLLIFAYNGSIWEEMQNIAVENVVFTPESPFIVDGDGDFVVMIGDREGTTESGTQALAYSYNPASGFWQDLYQIHVFYQGGGLAFDGNTMLMGNQVYLTDGRLWLLQTTLTPSEAVSNFGANVAIEGDTAIIGSDTKTFVFTRQNRVWTQKQVLTKGDGSNVGGAKVGIFGDNVHVGSSFFSRTLGLPPTVTPTVTENVTPEVTPTEEATGTPEPSETATAEVTPMETETTEIAPTTDSTTSTSTIAPPSATATLPGSGFANLLVNGSFEQSDAANEKLPAGWKQNGAKGDRLKCSDSTKSAAYNGDCLYQFKGGVNENSRLEQEIDLSGITLNTGDVLTLNGYYTAKGSVDATAKVIIKYVDGSLKTAKLRVKINAVQKTFIALNGELSLTLTGEVKKVKVILQNEGTSGKVRFDALSLTYTSSFPLPLP